MAKTAAIAMVFFANSNFNEKIMPGGEQSNVQQFIVVAAWIALILASYFRRTVLRIEPAAGIAALLALYALAVLSVFWSGDPSVGFGKAAALGITTFGAYRLVTTVTLDEFVGCAIHGLFALNSISIALALFVPDIGLVVDYQHAGQWNGIFVSKQSLGIAGAVLLFLASYRLIGPSRGLYDAAAAAVAIVCVIGSGSRGGGAFAAFAVLCLYLTRKSIKFTKIMAFAPFVMCLLAVGLVLYMAHTGRNDIQIFDAEINFTERTFIWQHALSYFTAKPWFGYGLNGFWTLKDVKDLFVERHGWFLDNYHDGYIAILMETGAIGLSAFVTAYLLYALRISDNIRRDGSLGRDAAFALVYTNLMFIIDFTETFFLRSTNMAATLLIMCFFIAFARRSGAAESGPSRAARHSAMLAFPARTAVGVRRRAKGP